MTDMSLMLRFSYFGQYLKVGPTFFGQIKSSIIGELLFIRVPGHVLHNIGQAEDVLPS